VSKSKIGKGNGEKGAGLALSGAELGRVGNDHQDPRKRVRDEKKQNTPEKLPFFAKTGQNSMSLIL